ncbi:MAG: NADH-quinone oxidoreductase subunit J [Deltaproteobacteria bacterium]|nr:NADH-quinone oxidoreductase subunit J [Deltaproteobacteria bacterium]
METFFFYLFALVTLGGAIGVIALPNTLSSAISLVVSLFGLAGLYVLLQAHFVAAMQILLYAGAIMVLFVFVIMLLNPGRRMVVGRLPFMALIGILVGAYLAVVMVLRMVGLADPQVTLPPSFGYLRPLGEILFSIYLVPFEAASFLLLIAIVGVVVLGKERFSQ